MSQAYWTNKEYELLEVPRTASPDDIKKAYQFLSQIWHPDANPNRNASIQTRASERMQHINAAYAILKDPEKRRRLDAQLGPAELEEDVFLEPIQCSPQVWKKLAKWMAHEDVGTSFQRRMAYRAGEYLERKRPSDKEMPHMLIAWQIGIDEGFDPAQEYDFD